MFLIPCSLGNVISPTTLENLCVGSTKDEDTYDPGIPPQGTHPTETHAYLHQNLSMIMPTEAVLMTAPNWTLHTCPPTAEWMEWMMKCGNRHTMGCSAAVE